jgi:hypothetical protein
VACDENFSHKKKPLPATMGYVADKIGFNTEMFYGCTAAEYWEGLPRISKLRHLIRSMYE